jgi:deoxyhypusine synthase
MHTTQRVKIGSRTGSAEIGDEKLFEHPPQARGYLRPRPGYRLFDQREELVRRLTENVKANKDWLLETLQYPLAVR